MLDAVRLVAGRYGVSSAEVHEVPGGVANRGFTLGPRLFVRVARAGFEDDLRKETSVVPVARKAGVRTPAILEYDESRAQLDASYAVVERVHGIEPLMTPAGVAIDLARLHSTERAPLTGVPEDGWGEPHATVEGLAVGGYLDSGTAEWLTGWFKRLEQRFDQSAPHVLLHGDVAPHNLLVTRRTAVCRRSSTGVMRRGGRERSTLPSCGWLRLSGSFLCTCLRRVVWPRRMLSPRRMSWLQVCCICTSPGD